MKVSMGRSDEIKTTCVMCHSTETPKDVFVTAAQRVAAMEEAASQLERDHVHSVYEKVAPYFNDSRYKAWPKVRQFLLEQEPGSIIADVGCGNGRYLHINEDIFKLGCDVCRPLVEAARCKGHEVQVCDGLRLPFREGCFDAILSISVIHHLSTKERRIRAVKEMARTLRVGGRLMIYVWAMEQKRRRFQKQDVFIPWNPNPPGPTSAGGMGSEAHRQDGSDSDKHRKVKSTSSVVDDEDTAAGAHQSSRRRWSFSRSLDSVLDFGGLAVSRTCSREFNKSCAEVAVLDTSRTSRRGRGMGLIRQVSSLFSSSSRYSSEDDVFGSTTDLGNQPERIGDGTNAGVGPEKHVSSGTIMHGCGSVPLPDLITHQKESSTGATRTEQPVGPEESSSQWSGSTERLGEEMNEWSNTEALGSCLRYYHVFREGELLELIEKHVEELHVLQSYFDHANWCVVAEKVEVWKV
ncbi:probable tRNA methyltransferase 9B isoform X1 [Paramormyrops kingsleyae]|uniref:probable tRNA methyltransferase 9B isoform X1 n=2 Tax=Paramormyrops kingsleyae TaxID=1676925 RepID=UPI003B970635